MQISTMDVSKLANRIGDLLYYGSESFLPQPEIAYKFYNISSVEFARPESTFSVGYMHHKGEGATFNRSKALESYDVIITKAMSG